jgi:4-amino-4-deoxy-L-arabinose transferase-like glycosyltransferase
VFAFGSIWFFAIGWAFRVPPRIGQDPYGYFDLARSIHEGRGFTFSHPWEAFVPSFGPGYPAVLAALFRFVGPSVGAARVLTFLVAAASPALLVRALAKRETALLAGLFLLASPLLARASLTLMSDGLAVLALVATAASAHAFARSPSPARGAALGLLASAAVAVRYACVPISLLATFGATWSAVSDRSNVMSRKHLAASALATVLAAAAGFLILVAVVGWHALVAHPVGAAFSPARAFSVRAEGADGSLDWGAPLALVYASDLARPGIVGPALVFAAAFGCARAPRGVTVVSLGWMGASIALVLGLPEHNSRFWALSLPPFAVLGAYGVQNLEPRLRTAASLAVIALGMAGSAREARRMGGQAAEERARVALVGRAPSEEGPVRVFTLELSPALSASLPDVEILEASATTDAQWSAALVREGSCVLVVMRGAAEKWRNEPAWPRIEQAFARGAQEYGTAGGATAYRFACGSVKAR